MASAFAEYRVSKSVSRPVNLEVKYGEFLKLKRLAIQLHHCQREISQLSSIFNWKSYLATESKLEGYGKFIMIASN